MNNMVEKLEDILNTKDSIKTAIESKGQHVGDAPLADYASKIENISSSGDMSLYALIENVGKNEDLATADKETLVGAINELKSMLDDIGTVTDPEGIVEALSNKVDKETIGDLANLETMYKESIVDAINELHLILINNEGALDDKVNQEDFDNELSIIQDAIEMIAQEPGTPGADGKSAYQIWLDKGNTGTEQDFLDSLEGPQGPTGQDGQPGQPGADGADGYTPVKGVDYFDGQDGQDGKSAYQIWLDAGNTGTEQDFIDSLEGPQGPPGEWEGGEIELPNKGSISDVSNTGSVETEHLRQVNVSGGFITGGGSTASGNKSQVNGSSNSRAAGNMTQVNVSRDSAAFGNMTQVNASQDSTANGYTSQVSASRDSTASGTHSQVNASSNISTASGTRSQVNASSFSKASGFGSQVNASSRVLNNTDNSSAWGYGDSGIDPSTQNIKIHLLSQSGDINHSGVLNSGHNFTDFAELFPNLTGEEQGYGLLQTIDGHGVHPANSGDQVVGVTSATAGVVLGETTFSWQDRWLKDEWGAFIYHDVPDMDWEPNEEAGETEDDRPTITVHKENPDYDPEREYSKRQERPDEWTVVGLVGQVYVRLDENVEPMDYVKPLKDGVGQTSDEPTNIRVMKITQEFDEDKGYKIGFCLLK